MRYNKKLSACLSTAVAIALGAGVMAGNAVGSPFVGITTSRWSFGSNVPQHVKIKDEPLSLTVTPTQNIDNAYVILGSISAGGIESVNLTKDYLNGELSYLGDLTAGTQYPVASAAKDLPTVVHSHAGGPGRRSAPIALYHQSAWPSCRPASFSAPAAFPAAAE